MGAQVDTLSQELEQQQRRAVGKSLWRQLVSADFWEGQLDEDARAAGLPLTLLYHRFCGQKVDKASKKELVDASPMSLDAVSTWIATGVPEHLHEWCRDE